MSPDPIDELFAAPLDEFTKRRNELAKQLRSAGDRDASDRVTSLRRPTLTAWAINQLARTEAASVSDLVETQESLGRAEDRDELQELIAKRRRLIAQLTARATVLLTEAGHSAQSPEKISSALLAANTKDERELLQKGRLERELTGGGLDEAWSVSASSKPVTKAPSEAKKRAEEEAQSLGGEAAEAREMAIELAGRATRLRREADLAEQAAAVAARRAEQLEKKATVARAKAERRR